MTPKATLQKIKHRLAVGGSVPANSSGVHLSGQDRRTASWGDDYIQNPSHGIYQSNQTSNTCANDSNVQYPSSVGHSRSLSKFSAASDVLQEKLDFQASALDKLTRTMRKFQIEREMYQRQVCGLKEEVSVLNARSLGGVNLEIEGKLRNGNRKLTMKYR